MAFSTRESEVLGALDQTHGEMVELLRKLVNIDSGSYCKAGVDAVVDALRQHLEARGVVCEVRPNDTYGNCMRAAVNSREGSAERPVLLMGHCDTVFPEGTVAERPFTIAGDLAYGPGVADMKSGLVINSYVLETFARLGSPVPLVGLYTADEEIASPSSRPMIEAEARHARAVLNGEPGRPTGNVVTGRKGAMFIEFEVTGKAAHSGVNHRDGISAIEALCRKVPRLHAITDYQTGVTANVGLISGGTSVNTVAAHARASVDVRYSTIDAMKAVKSQIVDIVQKEELKGTTARIVAEGTFLPFVPSPGSKALFEGYAEAAMELGFKVEGEFTGGSADSGLTSAAGVPTLCATGPVGGKPHTAEEYLVLSSLVPRAKVLALTIMRLKV
jgi:glutamate carboxypeptidase